MTNTLPTPCAFGALQYHPGSSKLVLVNTGNYPNFTQFTLNTWTWNGSDWTLAATGINSNPKPRINPGLAYDGTNLVLFGGTGVKGTEFMNDTWTWNGTSWSQAIANYNTAGPSIRTGAYMAPMTGGLVLWAGKDYNFYNNDTWTWNSATSWTAQTPANYPSIRVHASFASNGTNNAILFGGANVSNELNDTWAWNGSNWSQLTTTNTPSIRSGHVMTWDAGHGYFLMFGGRNGSGPLNETWTFDGVSTWTQKFPAVSPSVRVGAMMAYDTATSQVILFGGKDSKNQLNDTWTWNGSTWIQL